MPCYVPLRGYLSQKRSPSGKRRVVFKAREGLQDRHVDVPCGQCIGCRLEYKRQWALRCVHEASLYKHNSFLTLTYNDDNLPDGGTLVKEHWQEFMKALRQWRVRTCPGCKGEGKDCMECESRRIRFYMVGEYGEDKQRPHYHALLFNLDFADKYGIRRSKRHLVYGSPQVEKIWQKGDIYLGTVTPASAQYVTGYITKAVRGKEDEVKAYYGERLPPFTLMSRRPGIGRGWYDKYKKEVAQWDTVISDGVEVKAPKAYDKYLETEFPERFAQLKGKRKAAVKYEETSDVRLDKKRRVKIAQLRTFSKKGVL